MSIFNWPKFSRFLELYFCQFLIDPNFLDFWSFIFVNFWLTQIFYIFQALFLSIFDFPNFSRFFSIFQFPPKFSRFLFNFQWNKHKNVQINQFITQFRGSQACFSPFLGQFQEHSFLQVSFSMLSSWILHTPETQKQRKISKQSLN